MRCSSIQRLARCAGPVLLALAACDFGAAPGLDRPFACLSNDDCAEGFECLQSRCAPLGTSADGGDDAGRDAGPPDAGRTDAGTDAGRTDAGADAGTEPSQVALLAPPGAVAAGACVPLRLELRDRAGTPRAASTPLSLGLQVTPGLVAFHDTMTCDSQVSGVAMPAGQTQATVWATTPTGGSYALSLGAPLDPAQLSLEVRPLVRRGTCALPMGTEAVRCDITPPQTSLARTTLWHQFQSTGDRAACTRVLCELTSPDALTCRRDDACVAGTITWQTAETDWLEVRTYDAGCTMTDGLVLATGVDAGKSFTLLSSRMSSGGLNGDDFQTVAVRSGRLELDWSDCNNTAAAKVQLVSSPRLTVRHGEAKLDGGQLNATLATGFDGGGVALVSWRLDGGLLDNAGCDRLLRAEQQNGALVVSRGNGNPAPECRYEPIVGLAWQHVDFGGAARTFHLDVRLDGGVASRVVAIPQVDATRTLAFTTTQQGGSGQGGGETDFRGGVLGEAVVGLTVLDGGTSLELKRAASVGACRFEVQLLELSP